MCAGAYPGASRPPPPGAGVHYRTARKIHKSRACDGSHVKSIRDRGTRRPPEGSRFNMCNGTPSGTYTQGTKKDRIGPGGVRCDPGEAALLLCCYGRIRRDPGGTGGAVWCGVLRVDLVEPVEHRPRAVLMGAGEPCGRAPIRGDGAQKGCQASLRCCGIPASSARTSASR
ncbi:hypothetical protein SCOCK_30009 [Actinacidiphila cocklensis]|uniref:Uncharacterized protein n=1 Tax=Actinacidiphila cocklensis TaxID=887465 RepID=A0A9W4GRJ8_9ACTN|nr:hypothetical protein SCOCK_30009 [Actinacidiphila cocklensis]